MKQKLANRKIAILATDGFEESELLEPKKAIEEAGGTVEIISLKEGSIRSWKDDNWGQAIRVDKIVYQAMVGDYTGLVLPGGVINADKLRADQNAVGFVSAFVEDGKPIAAICHAAWTLVETGYVEDHKMTSWPSLRTDLENAGAEWVDEEVVVDNAWVTSRKPQDLPAFNAKLIEVFSQQKKQKSFQTSDVSTNNATRM